MKRADGTVDRRNTDDGTRSRNRAGWTLPLVCVIAGGLVLLILPGVLPPVSGVVALGLVLTTVFWKIRSHLPSILLVFVTVLLVSVVLTRPLPKMRPDRLTADEGDRLSRVWAASGAFDHNLPIVVHLVFDEMMSVGAMTDDLPNGSRMRQSLLGFGEKHSFRTFDSVYSRYFSTSDALPFLMNREYLGRTGVDSFRPIPFNTKTKLYYVNDNSYFDDMAERGYRTVVFQATYINFCVNKSVRMCETFDSFDPGGAETVDVDVPTQRVRLWQTMLRAYGQSYTSEIGEQVLGHLYGLKTREVGVIGHDGGRYDVQRFPEWFDRFARFAATVPRGTHVFAHFLVPHAPYLLLESCVVSGKVDAGYSLSRYPRAERDEKRRDYYERYLAQVGCVKRKLDDFISMIRGSENYRDAVIVIHGDHGSRISIGDVLEDQTERDIVDNYATFFAVRSPGVRPGVDCEFVSLPEVFRRYVARHPENRPRSAPPLPVLARSRADGNDQIEAPMPLFGCATGSADPNQ